MRVFIAEDEAPARERLVETLARVAPQVVVAGHAASVRDTRAWLATNPRPELLLLDIQLADGLSLELFDDGALPVPTIFTTAYDEFALAAFKALAVGYLLKPVDDGALGQALARVQALRECLSGAHLQALRGALAAPKATAPPGWRQRFVARQGAGFVAVAVQQVAYFVSLDKLTFAVAHDGTRHLLDGSLADVERELDPRLFFRINRQVVVAAAAVARFAPSGKGRLALVLAPPLEGDVQVSQERAAAFRDWIGQ